MLRARAYSWLGIPSHHPAASATSQRMLGVIGARPTLLCLLIVAALVAAPSAAADLADEQALAEKYKPIVRRSSP
jgi:hypothetical protein